jgi:hypothetical protein
MVAEKPALASPSVGEIVGAAEALIRLPKFSEIGNFSANQILKIGSWMRSLKTLL